MLQCLKKNLNQAYKCHDFLFIVVITQTISFTLISLFQFCKNLLSFINTIIPFVLIYFSANLFD
jgi:hypothetical protein